MDEEGKENLEPVTNLFTLFPPQGIIDPGQSQNVRLVWRGTASPTNELCYRIIAEELPVNFSLEKGKAQIKILIRYQGTVYIRPRGAKPDLKVQSLSQTPTNVWLLTIANAGSAHENLMNHRFLRPTDGDHHKLHREHRRRKRSAASHQNLRGNAAQGDQGPGLPGQTRRG
jgi:P pilus assembly chaperone PapD